MRGEERREREGGRASDGRREEVRGGEGKCEGKRGEVRGEKCGEEETGRR